MSSPFVLPFTQIRAADLPRVGGKGANLGEMCAAGLPVPGGLCVTTEAYRAFLATIPEAPALLERLGAMQADDVATAHTLGEALRDAFVAQPMPEAIAAELLAAWHQLEGPSHTWAVRSSATAEDLPGASFAGQQDTYLNVRGAESLVERVRACWASLFTERAILYRAKNGFDHRHVALSVVVQRMVLPESAGIAFTADPLTGNRHIASIDAGFGLGEALVSGLVNADLYRVDRRSGQVIERKIGDKQLAIVPLPDGGTERRDLPPEQRTAPVLDEARIRELAQLCSKVEAHFGSPQDIEWALADGRLFLLQARPITTLFPLPSPPPTDPHLHVHVSFGHIQVMTDAMSPMGRSMWAHLVPFGREEANIGPTRVLRDAGGRLYMDVTPMLHHPVGGRLIRLVARNAEALIAEALIDVMGRPDFSEGAALRIRSRYIAGLAGFIAPKMLKALLFSDPEVVRADTVRTIDQLLASLTEQVSRGKGAERVHNIRLGISSLMMVLIPKVVAVVSALPARALLQKIMGGRVPQPTIEAIARGLDGNVTTEMDLAVGDLADVARQHPAVVEAMLLGRLKELDAVEGGPAFLAAFEAFLAKYGMRGPGEIDLARPRFRQRPELLLQVVVGNLRTGTAGAHRAHFAELARQGELAAQEVVAKAPFGLGWLVRRLAKVYRRNFALREHPKFLLVRALDQVGRALREEAAALVAAGRLDGVEDVFLLDLVELEQAFNNPAEDLKNRVKHRRAELERFATLSPPRVLTSDGESVVAKHSHEHLPAGAIVGTGASAGVVEGIARVVLDPNGQVLNSGEILVAPFTDPGWTPLFLNAKGLVMEVGGMMTHGSVVAREYGIPAVVCVPDATRKIRTGDRVRVDGDQGFVMVLPPEA